MNRRNLFLLIIIQSSSFLICISGISFYDTRSKKGLSDRIGHRKYQNNIVINIRAGGNHLVVPPLRGVISRMNCLNPDVNDALVSMSAIVGAGAWLHTCGQVNINCFVRLIFTFCDLFLFR